MADGTALRFVLAMGRSTTVAGITIAQDMISVSIANLKALHFDDTDRHYKRSLVQE